MRSQETENRSQNSEVRGQISEKRGEKNGQANFGIWILVFGISLAGCISQPSRTYEKSTVTTYAELTLLYEKEKVTSKQNDSTYQQAVKEFFEKRGIVQEQFKEQIEELSSNSEVWKLFIQDVSTAMDSLKIIRN